MFPRLPHTSGSPRRLEQQDSPQTQRPAGSHGATTSTPLGLQRRSASPPGQSQSLPPRSAVVLPGQSQRQSLPHGSHSPPVDAPADVVDLTMIGARFPRLKDEKSATYARRLHLAQPHLTLRQISQLSGVTEHSLKQDPAFRALPAELAALREQLPQHANEKNLAYARRLHVERPQLNLPQISLLSGVREYQLKQDPALQELPAELATLREHLPQRDNENNSTYARRLHLAQPHLTLGQISKLSGVAENTLKKDPAFRALPAELAALREQLPRHDNENNRTYARRLHLERPQLTLPQISLLSGVMASHLKQDPSFQELPAELAALREQLPQHDNESNPTYARRLHRERPLLTLPQISLLSGVTQTNLNQDPAFRELPAELAALRDQLPQDDNERNQAYARRLYRERPQLTLPEVSLLSGVTENHLKADPTFRELPSELAALREQLPRHDNENNPAYARRLHCERPQLTLSEISLLSGVRVSNLKQDPAFQELPAELAALEARELPAELAPLCEQLPQHDNENNLAYARRLQREFPQLTLPQISLLSGVTRNNLKRHPEFRELPAELAPLREQLPQHDNENNRTYARRLHLERPQLTLPQISLLSGVMESHLKQDPAFQELPAELAAMREQLPQHDNESNPTYARRLHRERPQLTLPQISLLSGVTQNNLNQDPAFRELPAELAALRDQLPQHENEHNQAYGRRLHRERPQLTLPEISLLSGVTENHLKEDPTFRELPSELAALREQLPRHDNENNLAYARRLHCERPQLTLSEISLLSSVKVSSLKRDPAFGRAPAASSSMRPANVERPESSARRSTRPKRRLSEVTAAAPPASQEVQATRSVRPRLNEPRGTAIDKLLQVPKWQFAGAMALMRHRGMSLSDAQRSAGLPKGTLSLVSDEQGRSHPHDIETALVQAAGAEAPVLQQLLAYLRSEQARGPDGARPATPTATPGLEFASELEAQLMQTPQRVQLRPDPQASQPELAWGVRRTRGPRAWEGLSDPGTPLEGNLNPRMAQLPEEQQRATQPAMDLTPAATPELEQFASELEAQLVQTPEAAQPRTDPQASQPELAWGARRARGPRAWEGLQDPGMDLWAYAPENQGTPLDDDQDFLL